MRAFFVLFLFLSFYSSLAYSQHDGYVVVKNDTIYGEIKINFEGGSIIVKQDSINRMFLSDVESVTILNETRDTYLTFMLEGKINFFQVLVRGSHPLLEHEDELYLVLDKSPKRINDEKVVLDLFGKKEVKDYSFVRNISTTERAGLIDIFRYFNNYINN